MFKIIQSLGKSVAVGNQNVMICKITNTRPYNDKKNVINKNIEK